MGIKSKIKDYKRKQKRVDLVGPQGVNVQDARRRAIKDNPKAVTRDVQKRMGEYKRGNVIDKVKVYKHPDNK